MALYRHIENLELILRNIPKDESQVVVIGYLHRSKDVVLIGLQRGNFPGDIWWDTPDGASVFNHWRIVYTSHPLVPDFDRRCLTAEALGALFRDSQKFAIAGTNASRTPRGSAFFEMYEENGEKSD